MSNETFKTDHGNVPKLTEENYPVWNQKIRQVLSAKKAYNIVTGVELLPVGNGIALRPLQESWHDRANKALARIHLGCCDELLPLINDIDDPVEMWEALRDQLDNASTKLGRTQVLRKFTSSRPSPDQTVTLYFTKLIVFRKKLIGTTENITNDAMKTHLFTTLSNSYETTIQILEQRIPTSTAQQCMDAIHEYAKGTTLTKEIGDGSIGEALYSRCGNRGRGEWGGRRGGGRGNGCQQHKSTYCKMVNHTTEACGKRKHDENHTNTGSTNTSGTNTSRNEERSCYNCGLSGHFKSNCIHFKRARDQRNKVNKGTASASLATARDRDLIWLAENATTLTTASASAAWVIDSGASHHMCNDRTRFNSIKELRQPIVIELGDDNKVTVSHHGLVNVSQEYKVNALYMPTFQLSLLSINQLDTAGYTSTFGHGKCSISSPSITIPGNRVNDLYIISPATALTSTVPSMSTKSTSRKKRKRASSNAHFTVPSSSAHITVPSSSAHTTLPSSSTHTTVPSSSTHTTVPSIAYSTKLTTSSLHTTSPNAASTVPPSPPTTVLT